ncbi:hypothetical protein HYPSUDRAFT_41610 [Hypholoma sublateritium FD-334 SS-4]|uniref:Uncharacterized protein n=1 Tax=Hypholoma sublateritium (strain FD-334 SS-4) TaxID=945553 RepID=A0A0D2NZ81_HYPSF|nr:hypothetical protein HYPSUDRAFT_41610 [Hypholoma sublateritium FD-334 SS-4]
MADTNLAQILTEKSRYIGQYVASVLSGVQISLFIQSSYYLAYSPNSLRKKAFFIAYGGLLCLLVNITLAGNQIEGLFTWIVHRDGLGGPEAYLNATLSAWYNVLGTASITSADIMGNALLMYRCYYLVSNWTIIFPASLFCGSFVMAILTTVESALPDATIFSGIPQTLGVAWVSLSVSFNILVTALICGRVFASYLALKRMGLGSVARERWGLVAILIESSLPFSVFGIVCASLYSLPTANPSSQLVSAVADIWGGILGIAPQLIILRVAMGSAWTKKCVSSEEMQPTALQFKNNQETTTQVLQLSNKTDMTISKEDIEDEGPLESSDDGNTFFVCSAV